MLQNSAYFKKAVTVILDGTKVTGFPVASVLDYERSTGYFVRGCGLIMDMDGLEQPAVHSAPGVASYSSGRHLG